MMGKGFVGLSLSNGLKISELLVKGVHFGFAIAFR